jgi:hypothetical protein
VFFCQYIIFSNAGLIPFAGGIDCFAMGSGGEEFPICRFFPLAEPNNALVSKNFAKEKKQHDTHRIVYEQLQRLCTFLFSKT